MSGANTAFWAGHIFREDPAAEARIAAAIGELIDAHHIAEGFGALAAGADLLAAEAFLARGLPVHIFLPFAADAFRRTSVRCAGAGWLPRFEAALAAAASVEIIGPDADPARGDAYSVCARATTQRARDRAAALGSQAFQIAVWDGQAARGTGGTAVDVAHWRASGGTSFIIDPGQIDRRKDG